jgi:subfamily B ATP-binding cassette protein MsbA
MSGEPAAAAPVPPNIWALTWRFLKRAKPYTFRIVLTILVVNVANASKVAQVYITKPVIDHHVTGKPAEAETPKEPGLKGWLKDLVRPSKWDFRLIAALAILLAVFMFAFGYLRDVMTNWLTKRVVADLRNDVAEHLSYLPLRSHYDRKSGDFVSRVTNDINVAESATNFYFDDVIVHPFMVAWALVLCFTTNWMLTLGALVFFPVYVLVLARMGRRMRKARKKSLEHLGDMTGTMIQTFGGIKVVKAFNMEAAQAAEFRQHNENYFRKLMAAMRRKALGENVSQLFMGLAAAVLLVGGYELLSRGAMTAGDMAVFGLAIAVINSSVRELSKSYNRLVEASAGCERFFELLDQPRETEHETGEALPAEGTGVEYRGVTFAYDGTPVLRDVSLKASPGEMIAVVGRTGAGKTTLLDLLCRFYDPQQGEIVVNGMDLRKARRSSLLSRIAVVTQEPFLFNASIGENIRYGRRDASTADVEAAAKAAHIHEFIAGLEKGYDTPVGERGAKLSGGQRQRVTIARAILRNPSILILDEATSSLDAESEKAVQAALDHLIHSGTRITFVIAHRLSTVKKAHRIAVLDSGKVVEEGSHDALVARNGVYAALYRTQFTE